MITNRVQVELIGGPQDGALVHAVGGELPNPIHVGPRWLGNGFSAWSDELCERFPCRYVWDGNVFRYQGKEWVQ